MGLIHVWQWIVKLDTAAGDVSQEITHQLDANGLFLAREVKHARDETRHFVGEVTAKYRGFETNYHFQQVL